MSKTLYKVFVKKQTIEEGAVIETTDLGAVWTCAYSEKQAITQVRYKHRVWDYALNEMTVIEYSFTVVIVR